MRAIPLVRAWLYSFRGFVVMTVSLAIAFSIAVTGPPTDTEIRLVSAAVSRAADAFGEDLQAAAIELCPNLPPEAQTLCTPPARTAPAPKPLPEPIVVAEPETPPPAPVEVALNEPQPLPPSPTARTSESELLGAPHVRAERPSRRASSQRTSAPRRASTRRAETQRAQRASRPSVRGTPARPIPAAQHAPAPPREVAPAEPRVRLPANGPASRNQDASHEWARSVGEPDSQQESESAYQDEEQDRHEASRERWRERRERRRRYQERQYEREQAPADEYYEEEPYPEDEEGYVEEYPTGTR
jgi:hypothetical protein